MMNERRRKKLNNEYMFNGIKSLIINNTITLKDNRKTFIEKNDKRRPYVFKNVFDSLSENELDMDYHANWYNFHPENKFRKFWIILSDVCLLISAIYFPLMLALINDFVENNGYIYFETVIDIVLIIEHIIKFLTGFYDKEFINYNFFKIILSFSMPSLIFYTLTCLPLSIIALLMKITINDYYMINEYRRATIIFKFFRFIALFKWMNVSSLTQKENTTVKVTKHKKEENHNINPKKDILIAGLIRVMVLFVLFVIITHIFACIWMYIGKDCFKVEGNSWIFRSNLTTDSEIYAAAFYFCLVTIFSIGYGDIIAVTYRERSFLLFFLMFASVIYAYFISALSSLVQQFNVKPDMSKTLNLIDDLVKEYNISSTLRQNLINSVENNDIIIKKIRAELILSMPKKTQMDLYEGMFYKKIKNLKYFSEINNNEDFIRFVIFLLEYKVYRKGDYVITSGQLVENLFMLSDGKINVDLDFKYEYFTIAKIQKNYHYGDILMFARATSHVYLKVSTSKAFVFLLNQEHLVHLKLNFPEHSKKVTKISLKINSLIEERRKMAMEYFDRNGHFDGFRIVLMKQFKKRFMNEINYDDELKEIYYSPINKNMIQEESRLNVIPRLVLKNNNIDIIQVCNNQSTSSLKNKINLQSEIVESNQSTSKRQKKVKINPASARKSTTERKYESDHTILSSNKGLKGLLKRYQIKSQSYNHSSILSTLYKHKYFKESQYINLYSDNLNMNKAAASKANLIYLENISLKKEFKEEQLFKNISNCNKNIIEKKSINFDNNDLINNTAFKLNKFLILKNKIEKNSIISSNEDLNNNKKNDTLSSPIKGILKNSTKKKTKIPLFFKKHKKIFKFLIKNNQNKIVEEESTKRRLSRRDTITTSRLRRGSFILNKNEKSRQSKLKSIEKKKTIKNQISHFESLTDNKQKQISFINPNQFAPDEINDDFVDEFHEQMINFKSSEQTNEINSMINKMIIKKETERKLSTLAYSSPTKVVSSLTTKRISKLKTIRASIKR